VQKIRGRKANLAFHLVPALAASNLDTWAGAQRPRPAGVRTPRASNSSGNYVGCQVQVAKGDANEGSIKLLNDTP
jgi:hypothetical protein